MFVGFDVFRDFHGNEKGMQFDDGEVVFKGSNHKRFADNGVDVKFFFKFSAETVGHRFCRFLFSSRELPMMGQGFSFRATGDEDTAVFYDYGSGYDFFVH